MSPVTTVDEYLATVPEAMRPTLEQLRNVIRATAPEAVEVISYGVPTFKQASRMLVSFGAAKTHYAFYPGAEPIEIHRDELAGYDTSKGTVRFALDKPLPEELITKLVKTRLQENEAAIAAKRRRQRLGSNQRFAEIGPLKAAADWLSRRSDWMRNLDSRRPGTSVTHVPRAIRPGEAR